MRTPRNAARCRLEECLWVLVLSLMIAPGAHGQDTSDPPVVRLGINTGMRIGGDILGQPRWSASIQTSDSTVQFDRVSDRDMLAGLSISAFPFSDAARPFGLTAHVSLLSLSRGWATGNGGLEGGIGFIAEAHERFGAALTIDFFPLRVAREWVRQRQGQQLHDEDGKTLTSITSANDNFFVSGTHKQVSFWLVWFL